MTDPTAVVDAVEEGMFVDDYPGTLPFGCTTG